MSVNVKKILWNLDLSPDKEEKRYLKKEAGSLIRILKKSLSIKKIQAEISVGGSFAKDTLIKGRKYDIDIFIRFFKNADLSKKLEDVLQAASLPYKRLHGSRDYFQISQSWNLTFELIPVLKIKKISEIKNITDLSYLHVKYIKKNLKEKMKKEIQLAKQFCKTAGVYGAESYVNGFSGYALECLIIYYKSFEKMLKELIKVKPNEKLIIDLKNEFKRKKDALLYLNENKTKGPVILIDPVWKERNALAALDSENFRKFQKTAGEFLKNPSEKYFQERHFEKNKFIEKAEKSNAEFLHVHLKTDRQEGDVAGTKMKKFSNLLINQLSRFFEIIDSNFQYKEGQNAEFYLILKSKKEIIRKGPNLKMKPFVKKFKSKHKKVFEKKGILYTKIPINFTAREFLENFKKKKQGKFRDMGITEMEILDS